MLKKFALILTLFNVLFAYSQLVINELDCDTPSTDDKEFIELKSTTPNFSLNGYVLVLFNGTGTQANMSYYVVDLDGYSTDVNEYLYSETKLFHLFLINFYPKVFFKMVRMVLHFTKVVLLIFPIIL